MTVDLYNATDVKRVREQLTKEQNNKCLVTGLDIPPKQHVLDHAHDDKQLVRGVLHRQVNAFLGKAENAYMRLMQWWYPNDLPTLMRECADYLEREEDTRFRHNGWIKKVNTAFNKLKESDKDKVLELMGLEKGKNGIERKKIFQKGILTKEYDYDTIRSFIGEIANEN
jgi:hypothetical protein